MNYMVKIQKTGAYILLAAPLLIYSSNARSDFWGGDIPLLTEIVANTLQEISRLSSIVGTGNQSLALIQEINRGLNDSMNMAQTVFPGANPGIYSNWQNASLGVQALTSLYGAIAPTRDAPVQQNTDQSVAEAISLNNSIYSYTSGVDDLGESIKMQSHNVSPGGAAKLTAESLGVIVNLMNQSLRTQATGLKLQAEQLALMNRHDKESDRYVLESSQSLQNSMEAQETTFQVPTF